MQEKKEFNIPKNFNAKFELFLNVGLKDLILFIPSVLIGAIVIFLVPISVLAKVVISAFLLFVPILLLIRPIKENIPAWKHLYWKYQFTQRQTTFYYRKEGVKNEVISEETKAFTSRARKKVSTKINTHKGA